MHRSINQWVDYIQTLHVRNIDMSLDRIRLVFDRLQPRGVPFKVVSVAGTNGKGSTSELLSAIYCAAGYQVGKYTSPHLIRFNERIEMSGKPVSDAQLLTAFERVEAHRGDVTITYFEYATLVAIEVFCSAEIDIAVLEVGLGGRLDAVNMLDADLSLVTNISIDHTAWLGNTCGQIAVEKAGIARQHRPCVIGSNNPPPELLERCKEIGAELILLGRDFSIKESADSTWSLQSAGSFIDSLPLPFGQAGIQLDNAATALQAVEALQDELPVSSEAMRRGVGSAKIRGRCQILQTAPMVVIDVAHNVASVQRLQDFLQAQVITGRVLAVCGMLRDKEIERSLSAMTELVDEWFLSSIAGERGSDASEIKQHLQDLIGSDGRPVHCFDDVKSAYKSAMATLTVDDCLVVFGSFFIVGDILRSLETT